MTEELLIDVSPFETRIALLRDNTLREVHLDRSGTYSRTGNIYRGKVERIMPGMQAAFVDIGLSRPGFIHVRDIEGSLIVPEREPGHGRGGEVMDIRELIHHGQSLMVQVAKDPIAGKGARLTTNLAIAARYLVLLPLGRHIGVSQKIDDDSVRERLRVEAESIRLQCGVDAGLIVRTAAEGASAAQLEADMQTLQRIWQRVRETGASLARGLVYDELPMHIRIIRDLASPQLDAVRINDRTTYERIADYVERYLPEYGERLHLCTERRELFEQHGVEAEIERTLGKKAELKSGGYLIIEQTEAMTTVDVNTGGYLGNVSLEETAYRTNLEAAERIPLQLQLRNLGGLIVIDFIDMDEADHRAAVLEVLRQAVANDPGRVRMTDFSSLGLVEMSRKRTRQSVGQQMCEPCDVCRGTGLVKSAQTTCYEVLRSIRNSARLPCPATGSHEYLVCAGEEVIDRLLDEDAHHLKGLVEDIEHPVRLQVEPSLAVGDFDVVLMEAASR